MLHIDKTRHREDLSYPHTNILVYMWTQRLKYVYSCWLRVLAPITVDLTTFVTNIQTIFLVSKLAI